MGIPDGFGSTFIGGLVSAMLYGITTLQTYMYYMHYAEDESTTKFVVAAVWFLDTLHTSFTCHVLYYYLITNWGVLTSLEYIVWSFPASVLVNSSVIAVVQCFFAHKIYYLCHCQLKWLVNNAATYAMRDRFYTTTPAGSIVALAEVLITVSLCVLLYDGGSHSVVPRTKRLLNTLIIYAVNRCVLSLIAVIAEVIMDADNMIAWAVGVDFISEIYTNSLLASLNTRQHLQSLDSGLEPDLCMTTIHFANRPRLSGDIGSPKDGIRQFNDCEADVIDITTELASAETTTLQREAER